MQNEKFFALLRKFILLSTTIMFLIGCIAGVVSLTLGHWSFDEHVEISEFALCQGLDQASNKPINPGFEFFQDVDHLYACGKLQSNIRPDLLFYWFDDENNKVIYHNIDDVRYDPGYFSSELRLTEPLKPGKYRVDVYKARQVIASARFEIRSR